jgi:uncharacterized SAM-binding protein YcdF (DUF218 family)
MFFLLKRLGKTLLLPPAGPLLLAALGVWLVLRGGGASSAARKAGWVLILGGLGTLWVLSTPVVADALTRVVERYPALDLRQPLRAQAIVILAAGDARTAPEYGGPAAGFELLERVSYGGYLARRTGLPVLISGGPPEALAMRAVLARDFAITPRWVVTDSRDTFTDAQLAAQLLRPDGIASVALVTSSNHEWRAAHEFMSSGLEVVPAPVHVWAPHAYEPSDYLPEPLALLRSSEALNEALGEVVRQVFAATHLRRHSLEAPPAR